MSSDHSRLVDLCAKGMAAKGFKGEQIENRLKLEFREIKAQNEQEYILELYDSCKSKGVIYPENQPNLLIYHLLDIAPAPDMGQEPVFDMGEYPDIDVDFIKPVQGYLKDQWAPATFGRDKVCSIGNYGSFGIKSALIDMARIFGCDHNEILSLTTKIGLKDEDGKALTFDKAREEYPLLDEYCNRNPEVADAAKKCLNRNRGMGKHAGGLIISNSRIDDLVPLVTDRDGAPLSAWVEGLHGQDLSPMGLIKFDVLVTTNLMQIAECLRLVKKRHKKDYICSDPKVNRDWSDSSYIDDKKALDLANKGDLLGVFQFDSLGIRQLCRGNVDSFDDLIALNSLYRPGPLSAFMHTTYIKRKRGEEQYEIHPKLEPILGPTYGIFCIHEDTLISMADGSLKPIKNMKAGYKVHSLNQSTNKFEVKECHGCAPTRVGPGYKITLTNGFSVTVTKDHKVLTFNGMKEAGDLDLSEDIIATASEKSGIDLGYVQYHQIVSIEIIEDQKFYGMSVADHHNLVANGIVVKNCYQEQIMRLLDVIGDIPPKDCLVVLKGISKKQIEKFRKYKDMFIVNGQKNLGISEEEVLKIWADIEGMSTYSFNKSVEKHTLIPTTKGSKQIQDFKSGDMVYSVNEQGETIEVPVVALHDHGELDGYEVTFDDGYKVVCSAEHKFLTEEGQKPLLEIWQTNTLVLCSQHNTRDLNYGKTKDRRVASKVWRNVRNSNRHGRTSSGMRKMQGVGLENTSRQRRTEKDIKTCFSLRRGITHEIFVKGTPQSMRQVCSDYTREYPFENADINRGQQGSRKTSNFFTSSKTNLIASRNTAGTSRTIEGLERSKSRRIRQMYESSPKESKTFSNGSVDEIKIGMGHITDTMRSRKETSRFCFGEHLDRSRRILSFFSIEKNQATRSSLSSAATRQYVERRSESSQKYNADSDRHELFYIEFRSNEIGLVDFGGEHAPIADTGRLVSRRIVRVMPVGKRRMYDLEVACPTHNFLLPTGIVTSNSHSCAYAYLAMRCLWLKAHYPIEFFTATLRCEKSTEKIKEYMIDAQSRGIDIRPIDVNESKENFDIVTHTPDSESIYYGFSKLKGLGEDVAAKVVENQRYESFEGFLTKFGTDAKVVPALIHLGAFGRANKLDMFKFYEFYKGHARKNRAQDSRYEASKVRQHQKLKDALYKGLNPSIGIPVGFSDDHYDIYENQFQDNPLKWKELERLRTAYFKSIDTYSKKKEFGTVPLFEEFLADSFDLDPKIEETLLQPVEVAERLYYGFRWTHPLENSPDYNRDDRRVFYTHREAAEEGERTGYVELELLNVTQRPTKTGKFFYSILASDAIGEENRINVWEDDYEIFKDMLVEGNLVKMLLDAPDNGFPTYKLHGPPPWARYKLPHKSMDFRVVVYRKTKDDLV